MATLVPKCQFCTGPLPPAKATGRPRRFCCDACRLKAKRRRQAGRAVVQVGPGPSDREQVDVGDLLPGLPSDPDELVVQAIVDARTVAAEFGLAAERARPELAGGCGRMADHIAAGLREFFS